MAQNAGQQVCRACDDEDDVAYPSRSRPSDLAAVVDKSQSLGPFRRPTFNVLPQSTSWPIISLMTAALLAKSIHHIFISPLVACRLLVINEN